MRSSHRLCNTSVVCKELRPRALVGEPMPTIRGSSFEKVEKKVTKAADEASKATTEVAKKS